jgi:hypothetical protein
VKQRERSKTFKADSQSDGSIWELCLFAVFFVIVFSAIARADDTGAGVDRAPARVATARRASSTSTRSKIAAAKTAKKPVKLQGQQVAQNENAPTDPKSPTSTEASANPGVNKSIRARQEQLSPIPTNALPDANSRADLPEPEIHGPRFQPTAKLLVETTATVSSEDPRSYAGWYQLALGIADKQTNTSLTVQGGYSREYSYERDDSTDGDVDNPIASIKKTWKEGVDFKSPVFDTISTSLAGTLAANRESRRRTFQGAVSPTLTISKAIRKLTLGLGGSYSRHFYKYDIRDNGTVNAPDQFRGTAELSYAITDKLSASASMVYTYAISYQKVGKATELSSLSLDYALFEKLGISLGVATERGTLEADGYTNDVKIFDPNVAQAFLDLNFTF